MGILLYLVLMVATFHGNVFFTLILSDIIFGVLAGVNGILVAKAIANKMGATMTRIVTGCGVFIDKAREITGAEQNISSTIRGAIEMRRAKATSFIVSCAASFFARVHTKSSSF